MYSRRSVRQVGSRLQRRVDRDAVRRLIREDDAQLVEVLSPRAYAALHLPGAVNIPLEDIHEEGVRKLDRSRPIVVYCYDDQ